MRVYYGYDCNDQDGFNNGHYLDQEVDTFADLEKLVPKDCIRYDCMEDENTVAWYTGFYRDGEEISYDDYLENSSDNYDDSYGFTYRYLMLEE